MPSAFAAFTAQTHWDTLLPARAVENQAFFTADQFGKSPKSFAAYGHSMIGDPWGGKSRVELADGPGVISAEIELDYLANIRAARPALKRRRL